MKRIKYLFFIFSLFLIGLWIINYYTDVRAYINQIIADTTISGKKSCTKQIAKFNIEENVPVADIIDKAHKQGFVIDPPPSPSLVGIVIPKGKRIYRVYIWRNPSNLYQIRNIEIQITEGDSVSSVVDVCYTPQRTIAAEAKEAINSLGLSVKRGESLKVIFGYGISSFIL